MEGINASAYLLKHDIILLFLAADIVFNATIDSFNTQQAVITCSVVQLVLRVTTVFALIVMLNHTFLFRFGLFSLLCNRFKYVFIAIPISLVFLVALRVMRISKFVQYNSTGDRLIDDMLVLDIWTSDSTRTYEGVYVTNGLLSLAYYVAVLHACYQLGNSKLYKSAPWINRE